MTKQRKIKRKHTQISQQTIRKSICTKILKIMKMLAWATCEQKPTGMSTTHPTLSPSLCQRDPDTCGFPDIAVLSQHPFPRCEPKKVHAKEKGARISEIPRKGRKGAVFHKGEERRRHIFQQHGHVHAEKFGMSYPFHVNPRYEPQIPTDKKPMLGKKLNHFSANVWDWDSIN